MRSFGILFAISLFSVQGAFAMAPRTELEKRVQDAQANCPELNCPESPVQIIALSGSEIRELGRTTRAQIKAQVVELARNLWPDTILEGSYENANRFRVDRLRKFIVDGVFRGYHVTYSDKAWDTDTCHYDPAKPESIKDCQTGRISESAFVDAEFHNVFRDEQDWAEFVADDQKTNCK